MSEVDSAAPRDAVAAAIAARIASTPSDFASEVQERANQEEKRKLRRIIYNGIERNNDAKLALESTKVLQKLVKNILDHPGEEKYLQFKTTNATIQRTLIAPKNTLEFAIAIGFRADVKDFQPFYILNPTPKNLQSLRNGLECLDEYVTREDAKAASSKSVKETLKQAEEKQKLLVKLAYDEDRREKRMRDEMEKQRRDAVAILAAERAVQDPAQPAPSSTTSHAPEYEPVPEVEDAEDAGDSEDEEGDEPPPYNRMPGGPPRPAEAAYTLRSGAVRRRRNARAAGTAGAAQEEGEGEEDMEE